MTGDKSKMFSRAMTIALAAVALVGFAALLMGQTSAIAFADLPPT